MSNSLKSADVLAAPGSAAQIGKSKAKGLVVKHHQGLSFVTHTFDARGRCVSSCFFDVPDETYEAGCLTGLLVAAEFMEAYGSGVGFDGLTTIQEAGHLRANRAADATAHLSRLGAAVGFLCAIDDYLRASSKAIDSLSFFERKIAASLAWRKKSAERKAVEGKAFSERMRAAKAAKRATQVGATA